MLFLAHWRNPHYAAGWLQRVYRRLWDLKVSHLLHQRWQIRSVVRRSKVCHTQTLNMYLVGDSLSGSNHFEKKKKKKSLFFYLEHKLHSRIHLMWPSCGEHVPQTHRLGLLANWDDLGREMCTRRFRVLLAGKKTKHLHAHYHPAAR